MKTYEQDEYDRMADAILAGKVKVKRAPRPAPILTDPQPLPTTLAGAFALGVEAGIDDVAMCCGCSGSASSVKNPYETPQEVS